MSTAAGSAGDRLSLSYLCVRLKLWGLIILLCFVLHLDY